MILFVKYIYWHYAIAPGGIVRLMHTFMQGAWHRFLIGRHLRTLFSPWHRTDPNTIMRPKTFGDKLSNFILNIFIRIIAAIFRFFLIITGIIYQLMLFIFFITLLLLWITWPLTAITMIVKGILLIV